MAGYQPRVGTDHVWFNGTDVHDWSVSTQLGVRVTEMRGWDERPDIRDVRELRSGQDGEYADNLYLGGRTITISGEVYGSSWVDLQARKRALAAVFTPSSSEVLLKVPDPATASPTGSYSSTGMTGYERASVRVIEPLTFGDMIGSFGMRWQVSLRASDPRIYSDVETSTDSGTSGTAARTVTVDQTGTYATPATVTVTGPASSPIDIGDTSGSIRLATSGLAIASGETLTFDTSARSAYASLGYQASRLAYNSNDVSIEALWMLNETSGTTADNAEGTSSYDGTYAGGFTLNQAGPSADTKSVALNGSTGYISLPYVAGLFKSKLVFEIWVRFDSLSGVQAIVDAANATSGFGIQANGTTIDAFCHTSTTLTAAESIATVSTSTWYRIALCLGVGAYNLVEIYDASGNVLGSRGFVGGYTAPNAGPQYVGALSGSSQFLDGNIGPISVYDATASSVIGLPSYPALTNAYQYIDAASARWGSLGTSSTSFSAVSSGFGSGSKLNVKYRDARL